MTRKNDKAVLNDAFNMNIDLMSSDSENNKSATRTFSRSKMVNHKKIPFDPKSQITFDDHGHPIKFKKAVISPRADQMIV